MNKSVRQKTLIFVIIAVLVILSALVVLSVTPPNEAEALITSDISNAVQAGGGAELWDKNDDSFNPTVLNDMMNKLFGGVNPTTYIKNNGATDWSSYGKNSPTSDTAEKTKQYWVVPASTINTKVGNATYGMVVQLDGKYWVVTSLTLDTSGNVVVTLMLSNPIGSSYYSSSNANKVGNNMYSSSIVREQLLTNANTAATWGLFRSSSMFAQRFLVKPKTIQYQRTETHNDRPNNMSDVNKALCK